MSFLGLFSTICQVYQGAKHTVRMKTFFSPFAPNATTLVLISILYLHLILDFQIIVENNPPNGQKYSVVCGGNSIFP